MSTLDNWEKVELTMNPTPPTTYTTCGIIIFSNLSCSI